MASAGNSIAPTAEKVSFLLIQPFFLTVAVLVGPIVSYLISSILMQTNESYNLVTVYTDSFCSNNARAAPLNTCVSFHLAWSSYSVDCGESGAPFCTEDGGCE